MALRRDRDYRDVVGRGVAFPLDVEDGRVKWSVPLDGDVSSDYESAIVQRVRHLVLTIAGQRVLFREYGSTLVQSVFDLLQPAAISVVLSRILYAIEKWEPRIKVTDADYELFPDSGTVNFSLTWQLVKTGRTSSAVIPVSFLFKEPSVG